MKKIWNIIKFQYGNELFLFAATFVIVFVVVWAIQNSPKPAPPVPLSETLVVTTGVGAEGCVVSVIQRWYVQPQTLLLVQASLVANNPDRFLHGQLWYEDNGFWGKKTTGFQSVFKKVASDCSDLDLTIREP